MKCYFTSELSGIDDQLTIVTEYQKLRRSPSRLAAYTEIHERRAIRGPILDFILVELGFLLRKVLAIFVLALLSLALACWKQRPFQSGLWKRSYWFVLTRLLYFPVVISLGVLYPHLVQVSIMRNQPQAGLVDSWVGFHW